MSGVVFAVLGVAAFGSAPGAPSDTAGGKAVISFYVANGSSARTSDYLWTIAFAFFLLFAGSLRGHLRASPASDTLAPLSLAAASVMTAGATMYFGFDWTLASVPSHLDPGAAQALNVLALKLFLPMCAGGLVFGIATGLSILRGATLPTWLGWLAILLGVVTATPAALLGLVGFLLWSAIIGILVWKRAGTHTQTTPPGLVTATPD